MRDLQGTLSGAKQSSAELMATSPYPRHPYKSKQADPLPHPRCPLLLPLELFALAQKNAFRRRLFLWRQEEEAFLGRGELGEGDVLCVGRLSEVNDKAHFCVGELELSHRQRALHRSASAHKQCQRSINMTMSGGRGGAVVGLSHAQSGPVCSAPVEVEF